MLGPVTKKSVAWELAVVFTAMATVTWVLTHIPERSSVAFTPLLLAAAFLFAPLSLARRDPGGTKRYGIDLEGFLQAPEEERAGWSGLIDLGRRAVPSLVREFLVAALTALIIFPPFVFAFKRWHDVQQPFTFHWPVEPLDFVLGQLIVVALPEEVLFRGYFQTRLGDLFGGERTWLGMRISPAAWLCQAVLFALLHFVVAFHPARLAVFFPGLVFGFLRASRGGIGAAIWFHAMSNFLSEILARGYL
jgi:membrane protease YdiL (CAAX protease family)